MKQLSIYESKDNSDIIPFYRPNFLYLKPISRINITVQFPPLKQSTTNGGNGFHVSSRAIIEKLKALISPEQFISIKTVKNTAEFITLEGDLETKDILKRIIIKIDGKKMKVTGIRETLNISAVQGKIVFPSKHDWDSFFRDASNMDETKAGERADTIHIQNIPIEWFSTKSPSSVSTSTNSVKDDPVLYPSKSLFKRAWEDYGDVRTVDIPMLDPYRNKIRNTSSTAKTHNEDGVFEGYVQFKEYLGFVRAMDALRGCFLAKKDKDGVKLFVTNIKVDFDKTKHLSEESIKRRKMETEKVKLKEVDETRRGTKASNFDESQTEAEEEKNPSNSSRPHGRSSDDKEGPPTKRSRLKPPPVVPATSSKPSGSSSNTHETLNLITEPISPPAKGEDETLCTLDKYELYAVVNKYEEEEAKRLDCDVGLRLFNEYRSKLARIVQKVFLLRKKRRNGEITQEVFAKITEKIEIQSLKVITMMRRINRLMKIKLKLSRSNVIAKRISVDKRHLELQNLLYASSHLNKEVAAVKDYKSVDEQVDLIPVEEFYKQAPAAISRPNVTKNDPHLLRVARLQYEYLQRDELTQECKQLETNRTGLLQEIADNRKHLDSIKPLLTNILTALEPAEEFFQPGLNARMKMYDIAKFLPTPLYIIFISSIGYQEFLQSKSERFQVSIKGDVERAKEIIKLSCDGKKPDDIPFNGETSTDGTSVTADSDSDMEVDEEEKDKQETKQRRPQRLRKHTSVMEEKQDLAKRLLEKHPLYFEWKITGTENEEITVEFHYMRKLRIVCVKTDVKLFELSEKLQGLLDGVKDVVLNELELDDLGLNSPNPASLFHLKSAGVESFPNFIFSVGRPYRWAQRLAGLNFPNKIDEPSCNPENDESINCIPAFEEFQPQQGLSRDTFEGIFHKIEERLVGLSQLWNQLKKLETRMLEVPEDYKKSFPTKNSTVLSNWEVISHDEYMSLNENGTIENSLNDFSNRSVLFFKATCERGRARIIGLIALNLKYPHTIPYFSMQVDERSPVRVDSYVTREIGRELNIFTGKEFGTSNPSILTLQICRFIYCLDVLLETLKQEDDSNGPWEFGREKLFESRAKGKSFRRPFKFVPTLGGHFEQRF